MLTECRLARRDIPPTPSTHYRRDRVSFQPFDADRRFGGHRDLPTGQEHAPKYGAASQSVASPAATDWAVRRTPGAAPTSDFGQARKQPTGDQTPRHGANVDGIGRRNDRSAAGESQGFWTVPLLEKGRRRPNPRRLGRELTSVHHISRLPTAVIRPGWSPRGPAEAIRQAVVIRNEPSR
jgi:hypothetical protein